MNCKWHACGANFEPHHPAQVYCTRRCKCVAAVARRRRKVKQMAVEYLGGECIRCGYKRAIEALEFHHRDPAQKEISISATGNTLSWETVKLELDKCDLLCANCHREIHSKLRSSDAS
jgi:hypothetical protein